MDFDTAFEKLIDVEKGFQQDPKDRGNWTGGDIGKGVCKGTKYGISAAAYPGEDIERLTLERSKQLYLRDYWGAAGCDAVPDILKFDLFDMAVNQGIRAAIKALQHAVGEYEDGVMGPSTLQAAQSMLPIRMLFRFDAARLVHYAEASDANLTRFGRGWLRRVGTNMVNQ